MAWYIHKHEVGLSKGGSEEGDWWYEVGSPVREWHTGAHRFYTEEDAYVECRRLNALEAERAKREEDYDYYSVLAYRSTHYGYSVHNTPVQEHYPKVRPHYE